MKLKREFVNDEFSLYGLISADYMLGTADPESVHARLPRFGSLDFLLRVTKFFSGLKRLRDEAMNKFTPHSPVCLFSSGRNTRLSEATPSGYGAGSHPSGCRRRRGIT